MSGALTQFYFGKGGDTPEIPASGSSSKTLTNFYFPDNPTPATPVAKVEPQLALNQGEDLQIGPWDTGIQMPVGLSHVLEGTGRGMVSIGRDIGNFLGLESDAAMKRAAAIDNPLLATSGGFWGNLLGQTAITLPILGGEGAAISRLPLVGEALSNPWALSAIQGATQGFLASGPGDRAAGTLLGGALGPLSLGLGRGANALFRGVRASPAGQALIDAGIGHLTPRLINPRSMLGYLEQGMTGLPFIGDVINNRTALAKSDVLRTLVNRAIPEGGEMIPPSTPEDPFDWEAALGHAQDEADRAYAPFHGHPMKLQLTFPGSPPVPLRDALDAELNHPTFGLTEGSRSRIAQDILDRLDEAVQARGGNLDSGDLISLRGDFRKDAAPNPLGDAGDARARKKLYGIAVKRLTSILNNQLPGDLPDKLAAIDRNYSTLARLESASGSAGGREGGPTWASLVKAMKQRVTKKAVARGEVPNYDLIKSSRQVFSDKFPMTGMNWLRAGAPAIAAGLNYEFAPGDWKYAGIPAAALMYGMYSSPTALNYLVGRSALQRRFLNPLLKVGTGWLGREFREAVPVGAGVSGMLPTALNMPTPSAAEMMSLVGGNG